MRLVPYAVSMRTCRVALPVGNARRRPWLQGKKHVEEEDGAAALDILTASPSFSTLEFVYLCGP